MASDIRVQALFPALLCLPLILLPRGTISYKHLNIYLVKTWTFLVTLLIDLVSYFFGVMLKRFNVLLEINIVCRRSSFFHSAFYCVAMATGNTEGRNRE